MVSLCLSRHDVSTDLQHDLAGPLHDFDLRSNFDVIFQCHVVSARVSTMAWWGTLWRPNYATFLLKSYFKKECFPQDAVLHFGTSGG